MDDPHLTFLLSRVDEGLRMLLSGFSVALFGVGSKISVLDGLEGILKNAKQRVVRIRGYDQTFPMIRSFAIELDRKGRAAARVRTQEDVLKGIEKSQQDFFVLVDSIDASPVKGFQDMFASLAKLPNVHLCATVDHCRVGLLWSPAQLAKFQWYWLEANTYEEYTREVMDLAPFWDGLIQNKAEVADKNFSIVIDSLTDNHRKLCSVLASLQLGGKAGTQIRSTDLLKACKKILVATTQNKLRSLMQELIDHRIVLFMKEKETGNELFWLPFDQEKLEVVKAYIT